MTTREQADRLLEKIERLEETARTAKDEKKLNKLCDQLDLLTEQLNQEEDNDWVANQTPNWMSFF